ncbi:MAG: Veg family protein [Bacilli bacterium]|nr:Veg family protein [Bacilli bacterium]
MIISKIREDLKSHIGDTATIRYNLGRNKYESYEVKIDKTYEHVFLVKLKDREETKSFTYTDVMTKMVKITY